MWDPNSELQVLDLIMLHDYSLFDVCVLVLKHTFALIPYECNYFISLTRLGHTLFQSVFAFIIINAFIIMNAFGMTQEEASC